MPDELKGILGEHEETARHEWHTGAPEDWAPRTQDESHRFDAVRRYNDSQNLAGTQSCTLKEKPDVPRRDPLKALLRSLKNRWDYTLSQNSPIEKGTTS